MVRQTFWNLRNNYPPWLYSMKKDCQNKDQIMILINSWKIALLEDLLKTQKFGSILNHFCWYFFSISQGNYMHWLSSEPLPSPYFFFLKKGASNLVTSWRRGSAKLKKGDGSMVQGQIFLKDRGRTFPI